MIAALRGALEPAAALLLAGADAAATRTSSAGAIEDAELYSQLRLRQDEQSPTEEGAKGFVSRQLRSEHKALAKILRVKAADAAGAAAKLSAAKSASE